MEKNVIQSVRVGQGLAGSRIAVVEAPENAQPGSLVALTQFLNAQPGMRASAGYAGEGKHTHVLRISGLRDDASFIRLLTHAFPAWQARLQNSNQPTIAFAPNLSVAPLNGDNAEKQQNQIMRFVRNNADMLTGLTYTSGNIALLLSGMGGKTRQGTIRPRDNFRGASAACYMASSIMLIMLAKNPENARDVYAILEDTYPELQKADQKTRNHVKRTIDDVWQFGQNYTWEIISAITGVGAMFQMASAHKAGNKVEMAATVGTLAAMAIATFVPERGGRSLLETLKLGKRNNVLETAEMLEEANVDIEKLAKHRNQMSHSIQENPLGVSAAIQAISNVAYGVATFAKGGRDWALAAVSGTSLIGNMFQGFATKGRGHAVDDVVSAAADVIMADPYLDKSNPTQLHERATKLAKRLVREPEIVQRPDQLAPAIERRVLQRQSKRPPSQVGLSAYTKREHATMQQSPFLWPRHAVQLAQKPSAEEPALNAEFAR